MKAQWLKRQFTNKSGEIVKYKTCSICGYCININDILDFCPYCYSKIENKGVKNEKINITT